MLNVFELLLPMVLIVLISLPLVNVFRGKKSASIAKRRMVTHVCFFFAIVIGTVFFTASRAYAATGSETGVTIGAGLGYIAAALATGLSALGAGIAVAAAAPAAIGAFSENEKNFGKSMIFVAMGEGVAIYGLLISIIIVLMKL